MNINVPEVNVRWKTSKGIFVIQEDAKLSLGKDETKPTTVYVMTATPSNASEWEGSVDILLGEECDVSLWPIKY